MRITLDITIDLSLTKDILIASFDSTYSAFQPPTFKPSNCCEIVINLDFISSSSSSHIFSQRLNRGERERERERENIEFLLQKSL